MVTTATLQVTFLQNQTKTRLFNQQPWEGQQLPPCWRQEDCGESLSLWLYGNEAFDVLMDGKHCYRAL